jgi:phosphate-selective porin OprO/OprP
MSRVLSRQAYAALLVIIAGATAGTASAQTTNDDLKQLIERQNELIRQQDERIRALERRLDAQSGATGAAAATPPASGASVAQLPPEAPAGGASQSPATAPDSSGHTNTAIAGSAIPGGPEGYPVRAGYPVLGNTEANVVRLEGVLQVDGRDFLDDSAPAGQSQFLVRRARPIVEGTFDGFVDFRFTPDFGGGKTTIQDAYIAARFDPAAVLTAGKFKVPFGLERLQLDQDLRFIERSLSSDLVPNRDIGLELSGAILDGRANYAVAVTDGVSDGLSAENNPTPDQDDNDDKDVAVRLFSQPFVKADSTALHGLGVGVGATWGVQGNVSPTNPLLAAQYSTVGQQSFFKYRSSVTTNGVITDTGTESGGRELRVSPQFYYYLGPFGMTGEYVGVSQDVVRTIGVGSAGLTRRATLDHKAWDVAVSWLATGEDESFTYPKVRRPYAVGQPGWGALEFVTRVSELELDPAAFADGADSFANIATAAEKAFEWGAGVNWYLTRHYKIALDYELTRFDGGATGGHDRPDERAILSRFQVAY